MHEFPVVGDDPEAEVGLSAFVTFASATDDKKRLAAASRASEYSPASDYYREFREAFRSGRRSRDDRGAMTRLLTSCPPPKLDNYKELVGGWLRFVESRSGDVPVEFPAAKWRTPAMGIRVTPDFAVRRPDGTYEVIKLYLKKARPGERELVATLWPLEKALAQVRRGVRTAMLDVRRCRLYDQVPDSAELRAWVEAEADQLAALRAQRAT